MWYLWVPCISYGRSSLLSAAGVEEMRAVATKGINHSPTHKIAYPLSTCNSALVQL